MANPVLSFERGEHHRVGKRAALGVTDPLGGTIKTFYSGPTGRTDGRHHHSPMKSVVAGSFDVVPRRSQATLRRIAIQCRQITGPLRDNNHRGRTSPAGTGQRERRDHHEYGAESSRARSYARAAVQTTNV